MEKNILLATDKNYLYPTMVLITSLFHQHRDEAVCIYLLEIGLDEGDLELIGHFQDRWKQKRICCIEVTEEHISGLRSFGRFSVAAFFRILGMKLLPLSVEKVLYMDTDMVVNQNLSDIFESSPEAPVLVCYDINNELQGNISFHKRVLGIPEEYPYFNSGMLLMDLQYMREQEIADKLLQDIRQNFEKYTLVDQDALNALFYQDASYLPWERYNCPCVPFFAESPEWQPGQRLLTYDQCRESGGKSFFDITEQVIGAAAVIHFCTSQKPWRDRGFYQNENMKMAYQIYQRYEKLYERICRR